LQTYNVGFNFICCLNGYKLTNSVKCNILKSLFSNAFRELVFFTSQLQIASESLDLASDFPLTNR